MESEVTIYGLCDPRTGDLRYVGKAIDLGSRLRQHRWEARTSTLKNHKVNWMRSLLPDDPSVVVLEKVPHSRWEQAERDWIATMRRRGASLTNSAPGGCTSPVEGIGHSAESKEKMRLAALRNGARPPSRNGIKTTEETRARLRTASLRRGLRPPLNAGWNRGRKATPEEIEKNRLSHIGKPWSPARRAAQERRVAAAGG